MPIVVRFDTMAGLRAEMPHPAFGMIARAIALRPFLETFRFS
ncbi:hypothetical protein BRPE64_BCDS11940 [Caballeronia insecticola]|uniref:Uncharacterized protein n=1 Tax=Caballeronia insecticola TaxID=758793 RepID=R4WXE8_9BURK|nr:hypothetical protein BRPE64_BCDS11940 [Caballeronia insecticola]